MRKKATKTPSTTYEKAMAEAVAEYKAWVASRQKIRYKQVVDYILPITGSDFPLHNARQRQRKIARARGVK